MQNQHDDGPGNNRAETEAPPPKPRHSTRPKAPRFLYVMDYEKRFPGTKPNWARPGEMRPFAAENPRLNPKRFVPTPLSRYSFAIAYGKQTEPPAEPIRFATNVVAPVEGAPAAPALSRPAKTRPIARSRKFRSICGRSL